MYNVSVAEKHALFTLKSGLFKCDQFSVFIEVNELGVVFYSKVGILPQFDIPMLS